MSVVFEAIVKELKAQRDAMADRAARLAAEVAKLRAEKDELHTGLKASADAELKKHLEGEAR
jgi:hypothetical protein